MSRTRKDRPYWVRQKEAAGRRFDFRCPEDKPGHRCEWCTNQERTKLRIKAATQEIHEAMAK